MPTKGIRRESGRLLAVLSALPLLIGTAACTSSEGGSDGDSPVVGMTFTRLDGSKVDMPRDGLRVWCGPWEAGEVPDDALHIEARGADPASARAAWGLTAVLADVVIDEPLTFPNEFIWDEPTGVSLFAYDAPNELSSDQNDASGSVTFEELDCSEGGHVRLSVDAVLGSEFGDGEPLEVAGTFWSSIPHGDVPGG